MRWPFAFGKYSTAWWKRRLGSPDRIAGFYPTPLCVARQMLELAETSPEDVVYDLGSGDGRIPILAAQEFGCRAVGIEVDDKLYRLSVARVAELELGNQVSFQRINFFEADFRPATVVTLYLLSVVNEQLQPRLGSHLRTGARIVSLDFPVPGWKPEDVRQVHSVNEVEYTLYLYRRRPLRLPVERPERRTANDADQASALSDRSGGQNLQPKV